MRKVTIVSAIVLGFVSRASATPCKSTGFFRDGINLTAALINPASVTGDVDATGCNIAVYYGPGSHGRVRGANLHGASYFAIVNNGGHVEIAYNTISEIGERRTQHGVAVYFVLGSASRGSIYGNTVWDYQKAGIVVNGTGTAPVDISHNVVMGRGPVNYIAQNGIQIGYGAKGSAHDNFVAGNSYTGLDLTASGGVLVVGGACYGGALTKHVEVEENTVVGNDVGVWFSNLDAGCDPSPTPTRNVASENVIINNLVSNTTGNGPTQGYQAGISDAGDGDVMTENDVCGPGYTGGISEVAALYTIDTTLTNNPVVRNNTTCRGPDPLVSGFPSGLRPSIVQ